MPVLLPTPRPRQGRWSLVNEGFATLHGSEGTRGMVVSHEMAGGTIPGARQSHQLSARGGATWRASQADTAAPERQGTRPSRRRRRSWRPSRGCCACGLCGAAPPRVLSPLVRAGGHGHGDVDGPGGPWVAPVRADQLPIQLGLVHGVQAIPILVLSPVAGSVADRYPRKRQVVVAQVLAGVMYAVLALLILTGISSPGTCTRRPSGWPSSRRFINQLGPPWSPMRCRPPPDQRHRPHLHHV